MIKKNHNTMLINEKPIFVISSGRTGSTLTQRILNCHQDIIIWGEHYGFLNGLAQTHDILCKPDGCLIPKTKAENKGPKWLLPTLTDPKVAIEWANPWGLDGFEEQMRQLIFNYFGSQSHDHCRWGFKEIRYNNIETLRFLKKIFPRSKFVFAVRDVKEVVRSKIFAFIKENRWIQLNEEKKHEKIMQLADEIKKHFILYQGFAKNNPQRCFILKYEDLVATPSNVQHNLLDFLGMDKTRYDFNLANDVMANVITKTKRDNDVVAMIEQVLAKHSFPTL